MKVLDPRRNTLRNACTGTLERQPNELATGERQVSAAYRSARLFAQ